MNYLLLLYILPTLIHAQDPQYLTNYGYPLCAISCIRSATNFTTCNEYDINCICGTQFANATKGALECFKEKRPCSVADLKKVDCAMNKSCGTYQNTLEPDCSKVARLFSLLPPKVDKSKANDGGGGLSVAAYAGIGIAGFILTIFAVVALLGLKRRRRRAKEDTKWEARHEAGPGTQSGYGGGEVAELQGTSSVKYESRYPKRDHVELVEMKSPVEVDVWHPNPQELDGKEWKGPQKVYEIGYPEK